MAWSDFSKAAQRHLRSHVLDLVTERSEGRWRDEGDDRRFLDHAGMFINRTNGVCWKIGTPRFTPFDAVHEQRPGTTDADTTVFIRAYLAAHPGQGSCDPDARVDDEVSEANREYSATKAKDAIASSTKVEPSVADYLRPRGLDENLCSEGRVQFVSHARNGDNALLVIIGEEADPTGVLFTYLDPHGRKSTRLPVREVYRIKPGPLIIPLPGVPGPDNVTLIGEGFEDALSIHQVDPRPVIGLIGINQLQHVQVKGRNRTYIIVRDGDAPGSDADKALQRGKDALILQGAKVGITDTPLGRDANDILSVDGPDALAALIANTTTDATLTDEGEVKRLAAITDQFEFRRERKAVRKKHSHLDITFIDRKVADLRADAEADAEVKDKGIDRFAKEQPWPEPIDDLAAICDEIEALIHRHVGVPENDAVTATMWVVHAHIVHHPVIEIPVSPRFAVQSKTEDSGKSLLLKVIQPLTPRPFSVSSITSATLFRIMDKYQPTLFVHEFDEVLKTSDHNLVSVLNGSHSRTEANVPRMGKDAAGNQVIELYSSWGALAVSGIGRVKSNVQSRFIDVQMKPATNEELAPLKMINLAKMDEFTTIRRKLARWSEDQTTFDLDPPMPGMVNRGADNWRVLLGCAHIAGPRWVAKVEKAMFAAFRAPRLMNHVQKLLTGIRNAFDRRADEVRDWDAKKATDAMDNATRLRTQTLIAYMLTDEDGDWSTANRSRPITSAWLRDHLHDLVERPDPLDPDATVRWYGVDETTGARTRQRGYYRSQFEDAWARYLRVMPELASARVTIFPLKCIATAIQDQVQPAHAANSGANGADPSERKHTRKKPIIKAPPPAEQPSPSDVKDAPS